MIAFFPVWHNSKIDLKGTSKVLEDTKLKLLSQWTEVLNKLALFFQLA